MAEAHKTPFALNAGEEMCLDRRGERNGHWFSIRSMENSVSKLKRRKKRALKKSKCMHFKKMKKEEKISGGEWSSAEERSMWRTREASRPIYLAGYLWDWVWERACLTALRPPSPRVKKAPDWRICSDLGSLPCRCGLGRDWKEGVLSSLHTACIHIQANNSFFLLFLCHLQKLIKRLNFRDEDLSYLLLEQSVVW